MYRIQHFVSKTIYQISIKFIHLSRCQHYILMKLADFPDNLRDCDGIWYSESTSGLFSKSSFGPYCSSIAPTLYEAEKNCKILQK
jgi:hypothetical protein